MKQSAKVMVWGGMTGRGLTKLHMLPTGQTVNSEYYINQILEKEVKPLTSRRQVTGCPIERKLFSSKKESDDIRSGWSTGSHFKGNSEMVSKESAKLYSQGWLTSELF